ncbi:hypothetical protein [Cohnella sp.]|uniref:hypothetical protein n=1 Tax=Cohnella sp. TaxID=1883426 RepID=UPI0035614EE4
MANNRNQATKAEVQRSSANKLPIPGEDETEFSAEEAAEVFEQNQSLNRASEEE